METHNLSKVYKEAEALQGLRLTLRQHSVFGFLGQNGAGATTPSRIIDSITDAAVPETTDALGIATVNRFLCSLTRPVTSGTSLRDPSDDPLV